MKRRPGPDKNLKTKSSAETEDTLSETQATSWPEITMPSQPQDEEEEPGRTCDVFLKIPLWQETKTDNFVYKGIH